MGEFPPKKLRNTSCKVLDMRRMALEIWLQSLLMIQPTPSQLLSFLNIEHLANL